MSAIFRSKKTGYPDIDQENGKKIQSTPEKVVEDQLCIFLHAKSSNYFNALMMARNSDAFSDAPPTSPPSTSFEENSSLALLAFTLPPYKMEIPSAKASPN